SDDTLDALVGQRVLLVERQQDPETSALTRHAGYLQAAAQFIDIFTALEHADAHAGRLGRVERPEQALTDELLAHAFAGVGNFDQGLPVFPGQADLYLTRAWRRLDRILDQV